MRKSAVSTSSLLDLSFTASTARGFIPFLRKNLVHAHGLLAPPLAELSLALVGDRQMTRLHEDFMGIALPTDVLTFPLEFGSRGRVIGGEVVVCVPQARRQSERLGTGLRHELLLYALHGMLHLCGFDDRTDRGFHRMHRTEDDILRRLGVGPVFAGPAVPTARRRNPGAL